MKKLFIVTKNELIRYFTSPLAYVYLLSFLLLNGSFTFYFGGFFARSQASLDSMFAFHPWLYLIFVPGISMRLWSEEFRTKTIIQIVTMPVSINTLVWGKFFAAWLFCGIALILTFPFWITVNILGNPDNGIIFVAYIASFAIAGCMLAVSSTMSSLTKNQVIALVLSVFANILFFLSGLEFVLSVIRSFAPASIVDMVASFSFITHFNSMTRGIIELRDIIFIISIIFIFNFTTSLIVSFKTSGTSRLFKSNNKNYYILSFVLMLVCFIGLNLFANNAFRNMQIDFTKEKLFTLSESTETVLKEMPNNVIAKLYYSPILGQRNPDIRTMFERIKILLDRYSKISDGKFTYKIYTPNFLDINEDMALASGLKPIPVIDINQSAYFGLSLSDDIDNKTVIPFFSLERQNFIEQDITQKIYQLYHQKKNVGIITSLNIGEKATGDASLSQKWEIVNQIEQFYNVKFIETVNDFNNIDILMLIHPQNLTPELVEKIKSFAIDNGRLFIALDAATETKRLFPIVDTPDYTPSNLYGIDEFLGFKFHDDMVIADLDYSVTIDATQNYSTTPKFTQDVIQPKFSGKALNKNIDITSNLKSILMTSISPISSVSKDIYFIPLIKASEKSQLMPIDVIYQNYSPNQLLRLFEADSYTKIAAARIVSKDINRPFDIIVVGDTDFMYDSFWSETSIMINEYYQIPLLDNANFVLNALDALSNNKNFMALRGKKAEIRRFDGIERTRREAQKDFSVKENEILRKIDKTKAALQEVWNKKTFEERDTFTADELALISNIRKTLDNLRQELSDIKSSATKRLAKIETTLKILNIYAVPMIIILILLARWLISSKRKIKYQQKLAFNKEFYLLMITAVILTILGFLSVYFSEKNEIDKYEGKPVFENIHQNINNVEKITFKTHDEEISFIKNDGIWKILGHENIPVYQERIRSFLSSTIEATYYEKKSNKAENLNKFGLDPIEQEHSLNTRIEMFDAKGNIVSTFEVGKYDLDIGRGGKAAYIKFDDRFQVWLIAADFIDLSTNINEWAYNSVWNLRFGRIFSINNISDTDVMANIIKEMLNIHYESLENSSDINFQLLKSINIRTEDGDEVKINIMEYDGSHFIKYVFNDTIRNENLKFFADYVKNNIYKVLEKDIERLKHVIELSKKK